MGGRLLDQPPNQAVSRSASNRSFSSRWSWEGAVSSTRRRIGEEVAPDQARLAAAHLQEAGAAAVEGRVRRLAAQLRRDPRGHHLALQLGKEAGLRQRHAVGQRDGGAVADGPDPRVAGLQRLALDPHPAIRGGQAGIDQQLRYPMTAAPPAAGRMGRAPRWRRQPRPPSPPSPHGPAGTRSPAPPAGASSGAHPAAPTIGQADRRRREDADLRVDAALIQAVGQQQRQLVRGRRTAVRHAEDADHRATTAEGLDRLVGMLQAVARPDVDAVVGQSGDGGHVVRGAQRQDQCIGLRGPRHPPSRSATPDRVPRSRRG